MNILPYRYASQAIAIVGLLSGLAHASTVSVWTAPIETHSSPFLTTPVCWVVNNNPDITGVSVLVRIHSLDGTIYCNTNSSLLQFQRTELSCPALPGDGPVSCEVAVDSATHADALSVSLVLEDSNGRDTAAVNGDRVGLSIGAHAVTPSITLGTAADGYICSVLDTAGVGAVTISIIKDDFTLRVVAIHGRWLTYRISERDAQSR
jgi:hypothetical protein